MDCESKCDAFTGPSGRAHDSYQIIGARMGKYLSIDLVDGLLKAFLNGHVLWLKAVIVLHVVNRYVSWLNVGSFRRDEEDNCTCENRRDWPCESCHLGSQ